MKKGYKYQYTYKNLPQQNLKSYNDEVLDNFSSSMINDAFEVISYNAYNKNNEYLIIKFNKNINNNTKFFVLNTSKYGLLTLNPNQNQIKPTLDCENFKISVNSDKSTMITYLGDATTEDNEKLNIELSLIYKINNNNIHLNNYINLDKTSFSISSQDWSKSYLKKVRNTALTNTVSKGVLIGFLKIKNETIHYQFECFNEHEYGIRNWDHIENYYWFRGVSRDTSFNRGNIKYVFSEEFTTGYLESRNKISRLNNVVSMYELEDILINNKQFTFNSDHDELKIKISLLKKHTFNINNTTFSIDINVVKVHNDKINFIAFIETGTNKIFK